MKFINKKKIELQLGMPNLEQPKVHQLNKHVNNTNAKKRIHENVGINQAILLLRLARGTVNNRMRANTTNPKTFVLPTSL